MDNILHGGIQDMLSDAFNTSTGQALVQPNIPQGINQLNTSAQIINSSSGQTASYSAVVTTSAKTLWRVDLRDSRNGKKSYVATVMLDKSDDQSIKAVIDGIKAAKNKGLKDLGDNWNCNNYPLHDGDEGKLQNANQGNYMGKYYLYARSYIQPIIVDANGQLLQDSEKVYVNLPASQYEGPVAMKFFPYSNQNSGISCSLVALMAVNPVGHLTGDSALAFAKSAFSQYFKQ